MRDDSVRDKTGPKYLVNTCSEKRLDQASKVLIQGTLPILDRDYLHRKNRVQGTEISIAAAGNARREERPRTTHISIRIARRKVVEAVMMAANGEWMNKVGATKAKDPPVMGSVTVPV